MVYFIKFIKGIEINAFFGIITKGPIIKIVRRSSFYTYILMIDNVSEFGLETTINNSLDLTPLNDVEAY